VSAAIDRLRASIDSLPELNAEALARALVASQVTLDDVAEWVRFDPLNYRRNLIFRTERYELRLLCWLPRQRSSLHGHGSSACAFRILQGTSTEIRMQQSDHVLKVGDVTEEGGALVHQIVNLGAGPLVSLHAYAPPLPVDQPPPSYRGRHVVIIGGGVSGAALAIHLLALEQDGIRISIVERRQGLGRGPAYGTTDPSFRLNVPAERMSLFPDRPLDFVEWARDHTGEPLAVDALLPRQLFGHYVEERLAAAIASRRGKVWFHRSEAVTASPHSVALSDGTVLIPDAVVLATGNQLPAAPAALGAAAMRSERVIGDPWSDAALARIGRDEAVLLCGTGLTAVDVLLALDKLGHRGPIVAVSRRGLLPRPHLPRLDAPPALTVDRAALPRTALGLSRWLRSAARRLEAEGGAWQHAVDALRPHAAALWGELAPLERKRFMRKLRPYWEIFRHRAAPAALATVEEMRASGRLRIQPGELVAAALEADGIATRIAPRGGGAPIERHFHRVILCTGPQTDVRRWPASLFRHLLADRQLRPDPLGLGLITDELGRVHDAEGHASDWLFTLGALRRPGLWETTSVPDLVRQAAVLAGTLLGGGATLPHRALAEPKNLYWHGTAVQKPVRCALKGQRSCMVWLTGLSAAGKSTTANVLERRLAALGRHTYLLDGDNVRHGINRDLGFSDEDRVENIRRVAEVGRLMVDAGLIVIVAFISPFRAERRMARSLVAPSEFVEVFIDVPLAVAESRDPKGLYKKARRGELKNFTGLDSPYEPPENAELRLDTSQLNAEGAADAIVAYLRAHGVLGA
jgi:adenylyl-sulfate kinase